MDRRLVPLSALALALGLGACAPDTYLPPTDFERAGTWQAEGINDRNLRAMVADPSHLTRGVGAATDRGAAGATAVDALMDCRRPRLPASFNLSQIAAGGGAGDTSVSAAGCAPSGGGAAPAGGGGGGGAGSGGGSSAR